jgi:putative heme iron utilization protein
VLVAEPEPDGAPVHALARVAIAGHARALTSGDPMHAPARRAYEVRFPEMTGLFSLADFTLFAIEPSTVRVVSGFAQAASITPQTLASALRSDET